MATFAVLLSDGPANAWGDAGHRIVAQIASEHLSPAARRRVRTLLEAQRVGTLPDVAMWADIVKVLPFSDQPSHVVHLPLDDRPYDPARDCRRDRCALAAMNASIAVLRDAAASPAEQVTALNMVVHLAGDLHQPLHTSADTGQRKARIDGRMATLHDVWDDLVIQKRGARWRVLTRQVANRGCEAAQAIDPLTWALEGREIARDAIFSDPRLAVSGVADLPEAYLDDAWPIVGERLRQAGCRLAALLNSVFAPSGSSD